MKTKQIGFCFHSGKCDDSTNKHNLFLFLFDQILQAGLVTGNSTILSGRSTKRHRRTMPETMPENSTQVGDEAGKKSDKQTTECKYGGNQHKYRAVAALRRPQKRDATSNLSCCCNHFACSR